MTVTRGDRGHQHVRRMKNAVDHCVVPLARRSLFADSAIPQRIPDADGMIPSTAFHRRGVAFRHCAVIASIAVHDLAFSGKVHLAVVGYMVQRVMTRYPDLFGAGASYYGIGNLITQVEQTHKFESRYIDTLVGTKLPEDKKEYAERSPINHLDDLKAPMIIFQGSEDKIVTPTIREKWLKRFKKEV